MQTENTNIEYKSLKKVIGKKEDMKALAETCVCLANAQGGKTSFLCWKIIRK
jgi:ATP-dependent DNA helicase RecG